MLVAMFGRNFDLYDGYAALEAELRSLRQDAPADPRIKSGAKFCDTTQYPMDPVSFEDALNRELERRAYIRARGEESMAVRGRDGGGR